MLGWTAAGAALYVIVEFSKQNYLTSTVTSYPAYVYDSNLGIYNYIENYKVYLEGQGIEIEEARLIKY